jgi:hypothetical protein
MKSVMYPRLRANWGAVDGYENMSVQSGRVLTTADPGYRGELYVSGADGQVGVESWTMARVKGRVRTDAAASVVMNQNFDAGWSASILDRNGTVSETPAVRTSDGLVGAHVEAGESVVEFRYWPNGLTVGLWLSALSLGVCLVGLRRW